MTGKLNNHYKGYVKSEIDKAIELFFANKTYKHIAECLGRTEAAIKDLFKRMGYKRYKSPTSHSYTKAKQ